MNLKVAICDDEIKWINIIKERLTAYYLKNNVSFEIFENKLLFISSPEHLVYISRAKKDILYNHRASIKSIDKLLLSNPQTSCKFCQLYQQHSSEQNNSVQTQVLHLVALSL